MVAQPTDESDATTLPDPELNPLLNPLLAAHMGRWAEVYFTNPPEKREQAIFKLLRELENSSPPEHVAEPPSPVQSSSVRPSDDQHVRERVEDETRTAQPEQPPTPYSVAASEEHPLICESCGHNNSEVQRFCGMCGMPLTVSPENPTQVTEPAARAASAWGEPELPFEGGSGEQRVESDASGRYQTPQNAPWSLPDNNPPSLNVRSENVRSEFQFEVAPAPRSYRVYVGAVLAILLVLLVYMTWRGSAAFWGGVHAPGQIARAVPAEQQASPPLAASSPLEQPSPNQNAVRTSTPPASPMRSQRQPDTASQKDVALEKTRRTPRIVPVTATTPTLAAAQGGSEELANAEKYLNAGPGMTRDTQEGARWLWKAVAKQNLTATFLLSDLYLRGDGVPKSCDQARLLLDAAARKGVTAAAERLRHLQAFGCQ